MLAAQRKRRRWLFVLGGIALAVVASLVAWLALSGPRNDAVASSSGPASAPAHDKPIGEGVTVTGAQVPSNVRATIAATAPAPPFQQIVEARTPILEIGPSGELPAPMTITMLLYRQVQSGDKVVIATNPTHQRDGWQLVDGTVTPDLQHVQFVVDHLSWFQALWVNLQDAVGQLKKDFFDGMTSGVFAQADKPQCQNEDQARADDYSIGSSAKDTVYWCFGVEAGARTLRVVNRRTYPLEVKQTGLTVKSTGKHSLDLSELARIGHTLIMPGDEAVFTTDLKTGAKATLDTDLSTMALGLQAVQVIADAVVSLALHTNVGSAIKSIELADKVLNAQSCLGVLGDPTNMGKLIADCFDEKLLADAFGWRAVILSPIMLAFSVINLGQAVTDAYGDSKNGRATYNVTIKREPPNPFADYIGRWYAHSSLLEINSTSGKLSYRDYQGNAGCTFTFDPTLRQMCNVTLQLSLSLQGGKAVATVTSNKADLSDSSGSRTQPSTIPNGTKLTFSKQSANVLVVNGLSIYPEYTFCREGSSEAAQGYCGA